jgi:tRNA nucleotidyltransferase (CCA-adding enzyme)
VFQKGYGLIEIMLPRTEVSTGPSHRDFKIVLDPNLTLEQDAQRRDFTWNALYKRVRWQDGPSSTVVKAQPDGTNFVLRDITDPTGRGLYDLQHKLIQTTHQDSFRDDPLRILRALRFVSTLGYDLSLRSCSEMHMHAEAAHGLSSVYKDRAPTITLKCKCCGGKPHTKTEAASGTVLDEMSKLLMGDNVAKALRIMRDTGVLAVVFPELAPMLGHQPESKYHDLPTCEHTFVALDAAAKANAPLVVRWALLVHDAGKPESEWIGPDGRKHFYASADSGTEDHEVISERLWRQICKRLNVPKALREGVALIVRNHMVKL